ncbi:hypothetical protein PtrM4_142770 [Pyrenophora tritici-repentis]|uniref:Uncharacterized protein n=1 Tax=Pyrenophora tritici-repentis TaxID=45151 RepID=A0A834RP15_9PLEO|nr:hypothetical protein A1F99_098760 [Pyrenophora tritici-repentis]KAF7567686.1 hypothetical protein PtrM4_142770 [Pyrenophora tritici-repentis]
MSKQGLPPTLLFLAAHVHLKQCIFRRVSFSDRKPAVPDGGTVEKCEMSPSSR